VNLLPPSPRLAWPARILAIRAAALLIAVACTGTALTAQMRRPRAEVTPHAAATVPAGTTTRVAVTVTLPVGLHVQSDAPRDPSLIPTVLTVDAPAGVSVAHLIYPTPTDFEQAGQPQPLAVFEHEFVAGAELAIAADAAQGDLVIPGRLRYQACDDRVCFAPQTATVEWKVRVTPAGTAAAASTPPEVFARLAQGRTTRPGASPTTRSIAPRQPVAPEASAASEADVLTTLDRFTVQSTTGGYLAPAEFLQFVRDAEAGIPQKGLLDGRGPLAILLIVLLGGLALNLTPCVLPMVPINLAIIGAGAKAGSRQRGFLLGLAYGAAMALVYGVLGLVVILTAGTFGTLNASPWFNLGIAVLFVVLALAMFDVIQIDFSSLSRGPDTQGKRGSLALAFTMGAVAALLAGACVAPVVIQVILFSSSLYATGTTIALALPFVLGLGMALPWPLAGAGMAWLPKPGAWMVRVKQVMGLLILATAVYYGYLAWTIFDNRRVDAGAVSRSVQDKLQAGWTSSLAAGLAQAEREQKPVLIDFWATWCKNCLTMDATTFEDASVKTALERYVKVKVQAEDPDAEPAKSLLARFKSVGLPTYVILRPGAAPPPVATSAPPRTLVQQVRAAIAATDFAAAEATLAAFESQQGKTAEWLEAYSWIARGHLAAERDGDAETHALKAYDLAKAMLKTRPMDAEPKLHIAYGAAVEVLGQVDARRGARSEAVSFLERERETHAGTSIEKRIQKNINLLSLEGTRAPTLSAGEYLGPKPPSLDQLQGKVVLLFFWAHWCSDCKKMAPVLAELDAAYRDDGLVIMAPTQRFGYVRAGTDAPPELETPYIDQVRRQSYPVLADASVPLDEANHVRYGVSSTPTIVLVDRSGVIRLYHPGQMTREALEARVRAALASAGGPRGNT
jgi:thiol:disulfide interchange protein DsbD